MGYRAEANMAHQSLPVNDNQQTLPVSTLASQYVSPMGCAPGVNQTDYSDEDVAYGAAFTGIVLGQDDIEHPATFGRYYEEGPSKLPGAGRGLFARNVSGVDGKPSSHRELLCFLPGNVSYAEPLQGTHAVSVYDWEEVRTWMYSQIKHRADVYIIESPPYNKEELKLSSGSGAMHTWYPDRRKSKRLKRASGDPVETERMIIREINAGQTVNVGFLTVACMNVITEEMGGEFVGHALNLANRINDPTYGISPDDEAYEEASRKINARFIQKSNTALERIPLTLPGGEKSEWVSFRGQRVYVEWVGDMKNLIDGVEILASYGTSVGRKD